MTPMAYELASDMYYGLGVMTCSVHWRELLWVQWYSQCCSVGFNEALTAKLERRQVEWIHKRVGKYKTKV